MGGVAVKHWVERADGVVQWYEIKNPRERYAPVGGFDKGGGAAKVTRVVGGEKRRVRLWKAKPKPVPPPPGGVRVTVGWSASVEKKGASWTYQEWVNDDPDEIAAAKERGHKWVYDQVEAKYGSRYGEDGRWRDYTDLGFDNDAVDRVGGSELVGEVVKSDRLGFDSSMGFVSRMARRMILEGRWFKQGTLDKWAEELREVDDV